MNRHHDTHGRSHVQTRHIEVDLDNDAQRHRRHALTREAHELDDGWRKHPQRCLDAELSLLPLWRQPRTLR